VIANTFVRLLSKANDHAARGAHDCTRETGIHSGMEISEINVLRVKVRPGTPLTAWALRWRSRRVRQQEGVTMMWITIGAAVLFYAYFKVRRRRVARNN
jgi:hypothetical protein